MPDVTLGWNLPAPATVEELIDVLEDVLSHVRAKDSWEGFINWIMPTDEPWLEDAYCGLHARYRVGNAEHGQGFLRVYTRDVPEEKLGIPGGPDAENLKDYENGPGIQEAVKLVKRLANLNEGDRRTITLQQIIDEAKACYQQ